MELKIILYSYLDVFPKKSCSSALAMSQLSILRILCLRYICLIFSIFKIVFNTSFNKKPESLCSSVCLWCIETFHWKGGNKLSCFIVFFFCLSFCVNIFSKNVLLFVPRLALPQQKTLRNIRNFECFLSRLFPYLCFLKYLMYTEIV